MKRSPVAAQKKDSRKMIMHTVNTQESNQFRIIISPSVAVSRIDIDAEIQQELDDVVMSCTDCIV